jgi:hypothetical protein
MGRRRNASRRSPARSVAPRRESPPQPSASGCGDSGAGSAPWAESGTQARRHAASRCGWYGGPISVKATGRLPKWCSPACRQRAWEQARAAASGLSAVRVVERRVEVAKPATAGRKDWPRLLGGLSSQLDDGRIYDRDLLALSAALTTVLDAFSRRCGRDRGQLAQTPLHHRKA